MLPRGDVACREVSRRGTDTPSILDSDSSSIASRIGLSSRGDTAFPGRSPKQAWASRTFFDYQKSGSKHIRPWMPGEKQNLEASWDSSHHVGFSRMNELLTANCRDYFDRPREWHVGGPAVSAVTPMRPTWSLTNDPLHRASKEATQGDRAGPCKRRVPRKPDWSDRHHITVSRNNDALSMAEREYFSMYMQPQAQQLIPRKPPGLTKAILPHRHPFDPDGYDEERKGPLEIPTDELVLAMVPHLAHFTSEAVGAV